MNTRLRAGLTLIFLLLAACPACFADAAPLPDFSASYQLQQGGLRIGTSTISLVNGPGHSYRYESLSTPAPLVSLMYKDRLYESSRGTLNGADLRPHEYQYERSGGDRERKVIVTFDWTAFTVRNHVEDSHWKMDIPPGTLDKLVSQLAMMLALRRGETDVTFDIADGGRLKVHRYRVVGRENLEFPAGTFETVKVAKLRGTGKRETYIWCAPALNYLPVRIWHREEDDSRYQSDIEEFSESLRVTDTAAGSDPGH